MLETADPIVHGILGRSKKDVINSVNKTGALALARVGAIITQHRPDPETGRHEYWLSLQKDNDTFKFKYEGTEQLLSGKRQEEIATVIIAWRENADASKRATFKNLMRSGDDSATALYLHEQTNLSTNELTVFIADIWDQEIGRLFAIDGAD